MKAIVFDGLPANIQMAQLLGADLKSFGKFSWKTKVKGNKIKVKKRFDKIKHHISDPSSGEKIYRFPDTSHMLKLARNLLHRGVLIQGLENPAEWKYIKSLFELQNACGFRLDKYC